MNTTKRTVPWRAILFTICLYAALVLALLWSDNNLKSCSANDFGNGPIILLVGGVLMLFFFFRSIYQVFRINPSYWMVTVTHLLCVMLFGLYFMF